MATITVSFDTQTKSLAVAMDGQDIPNVEGVRIGPRYKYDPVTYTESRVMGVEVETRAETQPGVIETRRVCASVRDDGGLSQEETLPAEMAHDLARLGR